MQKRAQVTIFVIFAILIITAIGIVLFIGLKKDSSNTTKLPGYVRDVVDFVEYCIKETTRDSLLKTGQYGGYYRIKEFSVGKGIPYYHYSGKEDYPTKRELEKSLAESINNSLDRCILSFIDFPQYSISQSAPKTKVEIIQDSAIVSVNYPISITFNKSSFLLESFDNIKVKTRALEMQKTAHTVVAQQKATEEGICFSCLNDISDAHNVSITAFDEEQFILFSLQDNSYGSLDAPYELVFAFEKEVR